MTHMTHRQLCLMGLALLLVAGAISLVGCVGGIAGLWDRATTLEVIALAIAVGFTGQTLVSTHCVPQRDKKRPPLTPPQ